MAVSGPRGSKGNTVIRMCSVIFDATGPLSNDKWTEASISLADPPYQRIINESSGKKEFAVE